MFGLSMEHLMIMGAVLLFFGPRRLPELGRTMGEARQLLLKCRILNIHGDLF